MSQDNRLSQNTVNSLLKVVDDYGVHGAIAVYTAMHDYFRCGWLIELYLNLKNSILSQILWTGQTNVVFLSRILG